jgi:catechol 2,3-dioxygenase-like lactoylglutathione lyase family enzyme
VAERPPEILDEPEGFPETSFDHPVASLGRVVHAVADLPDALSLFRDLLGGRVVSSGSAVDGNHWVELGWGGPGRLRLLEAAHADIAEWVGDRPGRLRHLFFDFDEPSHVPGATKVASGRGRWVVEADDVLGTRLVIASSAR